LCLVELLHRRHFTNATPDLAAHDFRRAVIATLFHDLGYLKAVGDNEGTGAKYTHVHEQRSCRLARKFLAERGWPEDDLVFVENLISATGPVADLAKIPFRSEVEQLLGRAVCTADYMGQMSDPQYPDKLEVLFHEFEESYLYKGIPKSEWPFADYETLLRSTPNFWNKFVQYKMNVECSGLWECLKHPFNGENSYLDAVHRNLEIINQRIADLDAGGADGQDVAFSHIGEKHRALHHLIQRRAVFFEGGLDVFQGLASLAGDPALGQLRGPRQVADLARQVEHVTHFYRVRKRQLHLRVGAVVLDFEIARRGGNGCQQPDQGQE
jgi:hypothetical protein